MRTQVATPLIDGLMQKLASVLALQTRLMHSYYRLAPLGTWEISYDWEPYSWLCLNHHSILD